MDGEALANPYSLFARARAGCLCLCHCFCLFPCLCLCHYFCLCHCLCHYFCLFCLSLCLMILNEVENMDLVGWEEEALANLYSLLAAVARAGHSFPVSNGSPGRGAIIAKSRPKCNAVPIFQGTKGPKHMKMAAVKIFWERSAKIGLSYCW